MEIEFTDSLMGVGVREHVLSAHSINVCHVCVLLCLCLSRLSDLVIVFFLSKCFVRSIKKSMIFVFCDLLFRFRFRWLLLFLQK